MCQNLRITKDERIIDVSEFRMDAYRCVIAYSSRELLRMKE